MYDVPTLCRTERIVIGLLFIAAILPATVFIIEWTFRKG